MALALPDFRWNTTLLRLKLNLLNRSSYLFFPYLVSRGRPWLILELSPTLGLWYIRRTAKE